MAEPIKTGLDVNREALRVRRFKGHLAPLARDLHVSIGDLEAFATNSKAKLPPEVLAGLIKDLFGGNTELDPATGLLRSVNRSEPTPLGVTPPPFPRKPLDFTPGAPPPGSGW
jgi:hypothetical protein